MKRILKAGFPQTLKYRLFTAFFLLILIPFSLLNIYNYHKMEILMQQNISEQSLEQLERMNRMLDDVMSIAFKTYVLLGQDSLAADILKNPVKRDRFDNKFLIEERFKSINNSFFLYTPFVYYTLLDLKENVYTSYQPDVPLHYEAIVSEKQFNHMMEGERPYNWVTNDPNYVANDISSSPYLLSLYALLKDANFQTYGIARVSIDYSYWFKNIVRQAPAQHDYYIINQKSETVAKSNSQAKLSPASIKQIIKAGGSGYFVDDQAGNMINYSYISSLGWYMINSIPMDILFDKMNRLKNQYFLTFLLFTLAFAIMTFIISKTITKPLDHLQKKMSEVINKNFKVKLPEEKYRGEILLLTRTYNQMLDDMNVLIQKLKFEERQKEAVHFQMLLSQTNPHFLLNTLNIIKWLALRKDIPEISEICVSLGKLLETSLYAEQDLIFLKDELELVEAYVLIQRYRNDKPIHISYEIGENLQYALIPKLSIEPLVENAFIHGLSKRIYDGVVSIVVWAENNQLKVEVKDNGVGLEETAKLPNSHKRKGIGLMNIQERLQLLFREGSDFAIESSDRGTTVSFRIPLLVSPPYVEEDKQDVESSDRGR
ncbi:MAG TPA: histidine kinase [Bacilli bacterium]